MRNCGIIDMVVNGEVAYQHPVKVSEGGSSPLNHPNLICRIKIQLSVEQGAENCTSFEATHKIQTKINSIVMTTTLG